jgi:hypothetical protein
MPDWKRIVREKLGTLPLTNGRRDEVIEELAQQLETAYEEALAQGINEQEAMRRSLAQFKDWEKLRREVFQSVEGTRLPVWEQNGIFSPRRLPVWIALALTLLLLALPSFRQGLTIMPLPGRDYSAWSPRVFSESALRRLEQSGDKQKYARALAFVALHDPDDIAAMHAAQKAIVLDPQLTWISAHVSHATYVIPPSYDPHPWIERLKGWDPQNGFVYLLEADANVHYWEPPWSKYGGAPLPGLRSALAAEPRWRIPMEKAFAAPRIDCYGSQQFALDRQVLKEQGLDNPVMLMIASASQLIPDFTAIKMYTSYQIEDVGERAEKAGRTADALAAYWNVDHFGEKLHSENSMDIEEMLETQLRREAYAKMIPLLRREGRTSETEAVESALGTLSSLDYKLRQPYLRTSAERSGRVVGTSNVAVLILGMATALWFILTIALKWSQHSGRLLNRVASVLCFAPPALLLASIVLFLGYYPYARSITQFHSLPEFEHGYGPLLMSVYDFSRINPLLDFWLSYMFWTTVWCALVAIVGASSLWFMRRLRHDRPHAA